MLSQVCLYDFDVCTLFIVAGGQASSTKLNRTDNGKFTFPSCVVLVSHAAEGINLRGPSQSVR